MNRNTGNNTAAVPSNDQIKIGFLKSNRDGVSVLKKINNAYYMVSSAFEWEGMR